MSLEQDQTLCKICATLKMGSAGYPISHHPFVTKNEYIFFDPKEVLIIIITSPPLSLTEQTRHRQGGALKETFYFSRILVF